MPERFLVRELLRAETDPEAQFNITQVPRVFDALAALEHQSGRLPDLERKFGWFARS